MDIAVIRESAELLRRSTRFSEKRGLTEAAEVGDNIVVDLFAELASSRR